MGLLEEIGAHLDSESTRFALGTNTYLGLLPDEPGTACSIIETGGSPPSYTFANDLPSFENARIAVTCRSTSSTKARANINAAWVALQKVTNETLSSKSWLRCSAVQSPFLLKRDAQNRPIYQANFSCQRRTTST